MIIKGLSHTIPNLKLVVEGSVVRLEFCCRDAYEARVLADDIDDRFSRGESLTVHPNTWKKK